MNNGCYVTPFLNRFSILESSCLLRDGFNLAMKNASKFVRVLPSFGAASKILRKKKCSSLSARCLPGSGSEHNSADNKSWTTFLHIYLFACFWRKKILFLSNNFLFGNQNRKLAITFDMTFFKSCLYCIYSKIPNYSFFIFYFWWFLRVKTVGFH